MSDPFLLSDLPPIPSPTGTGESTGPTPPDNKFFGKPYATPALRPDSQIDLKVGQYLRPPQGILPNMTQPPDPRAYINQYGGHSQVGNVSQPYGSAVVNNDFTARLAAAGRLYKQETGKDPTYGEGDRDLATQQHYWAMRGNRYDPSNPAARPGTSLHEFGKAMDIDGDFGMWLRKNGPRVGINNPVPNDAHHFQIMPGNFPLPPAPSGQALPPGILGPAQLTQAPPSPPTAGAAPSPPVATPPGASQNVPGTAPGTPPPTPGAMPPTTGAPGASGPTPYTPEDQGQDKKPDDQKKQDQQAAFNIAEAKAAEAQKLAATPLPMKAEMPPVFPNILARQIQEAQQRQIPYYERRMNLQRAISKLPLPPGFTPVEG